MKIQGQAHLLLPARLSSRFRGPTLPVHRRSSLSSEMIRLLRENKLGNMHNYTDHTVSETLERWGACGQRGKIVY